MPSLGPLFIAALSLALSSATLAEAPLPPPRASLAGLETGKQFDRFIVKYRALSSEASDGNSRQRALDAAVVRTRQALPEPAHAGNPNAAAPTWGLRQVRRMALGADVVVATQKLGRREAAMLIRQLAADPNVEYVELDRVLQPVLTPDDTEFVNQWAMTDADAGIRATQAWDLGDGGGVVVAVIDTGITDHSDFDANVLPGYDFVSDPTSSNDGDGRDGDAHDPGNYTATANSNWHGTHVAGTVAALGNNGQGVIGTAYGAKILPVRVLGAGGGTTSDIADGLIWAAGGSVPGVPANANPAEVANLSLGGGGSCSITAQNAINTAVGLGTTVVVAAGNDSSDAAGFNLANCANVIAVGAVNVGSARPIFSNFGSTVDVSAPGVNIISTINQGTTTPTTEGYAYYSGTSMATPHTAGTVALAQSARVAHGQAPYSPAAIEAQLKGTAYPMSQGCTGLNGAGLLDANALLTTAIGNAQLLSDGVARNNLSAATGNALYFALPSSATRAGLNFTSSGGSGDADLYVRFGALPTTGSYDCRSNALGNSESCSFAAAQPGVYYAMLQANSGFSGVSLSGGGIGNRKPVPNYNQTISGLTATFTDTSTDSDGSIASRKWLFGDGGRSTTAAPIHNYSLAGAYTVQLTATDNSGAVDCTMRSLKVSPPTQVLANGVPVANLAANAGGELTFTLAVPADATGLQFATTGGTGDADLYVKFGAPPTLSDYDCASYSPTTSESCAIASAQGGTYYVLVQAFAKISGVSLTGSYASATNFAPTAGFSYSTSFLTANFTDTSFDSDGSIVARSWDFGDGTSSTATNPSKTYALAGTYPVKLTVTDNGGFSNSTTQSVTVAAPTVSLSIADVTSKEGDSGSKTALFRVTLSAASTSKVTYDIATADGSATAGSDYVASSLVGQSISPGVLSKTFSVTLNGDTVVEPDETFLVNLSNAGGALIADGQALGTIQNDDCICLRIDDVSVTEGNSGTRLATFTVSLSSAAAGPVSYNIATANGTAVAGSDYVASSLAGQTIPAGQLSKTFSVTVNGDSTIEGTERFRVNISNVSGATLSDGIGYGTIVNDD